MRIQRRSRHNHWRCKRKNSLRILPRIKVQRLIAAKEQEKLRGWKLRAQIAQRVHSETCAAALDLLRINHRARFASKRKAQHGLAVARRSGGLLLSLWIDIGGNHANFIGANGRGRLLRQ